MASRSGRLLGAALFATLALAPLSAAHADRLLDEVQAHYRRAELDAAAAACARLPGFAASRPSETVRVRSCFARGAASSANSSRLHCARWENLNLSRTGVK